MNCNARIPTISWKTKSNLFLGIFWDITSLGSMVGLELAAGSKIGKCLHLLLVDNDGGGPRDCCLSWHHRGPDCSFDICIICKSLCSIPGDSCRQSTSLHPAFRHAIFPLLGDLKLPFTIPCSRWRSRLSLCLLQKSYTYPLGADSIALHSLSSFFINQCLLQQSLTFLRDDDFSYY